MRLIQMASSRPAAARFFCLDKILPPHCILPEFVLTLQEM